MKHLLSSVVFITILMIVSFGQSISETSSEKATSTLIQPIKTWVIAEDSDRQNYMTKLDETIYYSGTRSASIKSKQLSNDVKGKSSLMQTIRAEAYLDKRMRLSAFVKSREVEKAGLWFRVDGENMQVLGLDSMENRLISGSSDWGKYELLLDVPTSAQQIVFGVFLKGSGQIWIDDVSFEEVSLNVLVTSNKPQEVQGKESATYIEIYRSKNKELYEKQLQRFRERNESSLTFPINLDFESF